MHTKAFDAIMRGVGLDLSDDPLILRNFSLSTIDWLTMGVAVMVALSLS